MTEGFPLHARRKEATVAAWVRPQGQVMILLSAPLKERPTWYLLKTDPGLLGWVREDTLQGQVEGLLWAG